MRIYKSYIVLGLRAALVHKRDAELTRFGLASYIDIYQDFVFGWVDNAWFMEVFQ